MDLWQIGQLAAFLLLTSALLILLEIGLRRDAKQRSRRRGRGSPPSPGHGPTDGQGPTVRRGNGAGQIGR
jgi:ABC-type Fe3+ transport system permease subunit